jgi:transmembrane sensor
MDKPAGRSGPRDERRRRTQAVEWWLKLRSGEPSARDVSGWLDWHGRDPRNAEAFEQMREFCGRIQVTDPGALTGLMAEFSRPMARKGSPWVTWSMRLAGLTAAIAAAVVGYQSLSVPAAKPHRLEFVTPVAVNREIALPDGSSVELGADSQLNASFNARARRVQLRSGEAYFKVRHDERRPFLVKAGELTIRDVGTAFDVLKTGQRVTVTVAKGRVQVVAPGTLGQGTRITNSIEIGAGQQVLYSPGTAGLRVTRVDPASALTWRERRLEFVDTPLSTVIDNINRYVSHPIHIGDPVIGRLNFTGTVDLQSLPRWLEALQTIFPIKVKRGAAGVAIIPVSHLRSH